MWIHFWGLSMKASASSFKISLASPVKLQPIIGLTQAFCWVGSCVGGGSSNNLYLGGTCVESGRGPIQFDDFRNYF